MKNKKIFKITNYVFQILILIILLSIFAIKFAKVWNMFEPMHMIIGGSSPDTKEFLNIFDHLTLISMIFLIILYVVSRFWLHKNWKMLIWDIVLILWAVSIYIYGFLNKKYGEFRGFNITEDVGPWDWQIGWEIDIYEWAVKASLWTLSWGLIYGFIDYITPFIKLKKQ